MLLLAKRYAWEKNRRRINSKRFVQKWDKINEFTGFVKQTTDTINRISNVIFHNAIWNLCHLQFLSILFLLFVWVQKHITMRLNSFRCYEKIVIQNVLKENRNGYAKKKNTETERDSLSEAMRLFFRICHNEVNIQVRKTTG